MGHAEQEPSNVFPLRTMRDRIDEVVREDLTTSFEWSIATIRHPNGLTPSMIRHAKRTFIETITAARMNRFDPSVLIREAEELLDGSSEEPK